ncbi:MAG: DNA gyrase inhibitor YacG [Sphingomonadales bacterium]|jgi:endogenous inhibitor of DNA gyrase (YacG/DUF329 family)
MIKKPNSCPQCGKGVKIEFKPFCSKRCADIDLGAWLNESYRLPGSQEGRENEVEELIDGLEQKAKKTE